MLVEDVHSIEEHLARSIVLLSLFVLQLIISRMGLFVEAEIVKPRNDIREYRTVLLPNGLQVLLISDPETDKVRHFFSPYPAACIQDRPGAKY